MTAGTPEVWWLEQLGPMSIKSGREEVRYSEPPLKQWMFHTYEPKKGKNNRHGKCKTQWNSPKNDNIIKSFKKHTSLTDQTQNSNIILRKKLMTVKKKKNLSNYLHYTEESIGT